MNKKIIVKYLENELFNSIVPRNVNTIEKSIKEYGDPQSVYSGEILIALNNSK